MWVASMITSGVVVQRYNTSIAMSGSKLTPPATVEKSVLAAVLLAYILGPLGTFYAGRKTFVVFMAILLIGLIVSLLGFWQLARFGVVLIWLASMITNGLVVQRYNSQMRNGEK